MTWIGLIVGLICGWLIRDAVAAEAERKRELEAGVWKQVPRCRGGGAKTDGP